MKFSRDSSKKQASLAITIEIINFILSTLKICLKEHDNLNIIQYGLKMFFKIIKDFEINNS